MSYIIGIDEVGRGALAGPVVVAAALVPNGWRPPRFAPGRSVRIKLRDSKKLQPHHREAWFSYFGNHPTIRFAVARVYPKTIDRINISRAANLAALRAFTSLVTSYSLPVTRVSVFLDGGLYLGRYRNHLPHPSRKYDRLASHGLLNGHEAKEVQTIVRGDEKITAIKIASIIAKVHRDRLMVRLAKKFPQYGFEIHKGYGTARHRQTIARFGDCEIHRKTFLS